MKSHPLRLRHDIVRQTFCWLIGHRWVSSWRRVSTKARRGKHANPYYDHVATWYVKCRRCRLRCAHDRFDPWFKSAWWSWRGFWSAFGIMFACYWKTASWRQRILLPVAAVAFGIEQSWAQWSCDRGWPFWPTEAAGMVTHWFSEWVERRRPPPSKVRMKVRILSPPQTYTASTGTTTLLEVRFP